MRIPLLLSGEFDCWLVSLFIYDVFILCVCFIGIYRELAGPWDIEIAREIRPESIRAKYGRDRVLSGIHCTDLVQDGVNEVEYCFHIMNSMLV